MAVADHLIWGGIEYSIQPPVDLGDLITQASVGQIVAAAQFGPDSAETRHFTSSRIQVAFAIDEALRNYPATSGQDYVPFLKGAFKAAGRNIVEAQRFFDN